MGLFEGKEQKQLKKQLKEEEKAAERAEAAAAKVRAKLESRHMENIDDEFAEDCAAIISSLGGTGMMELGRALSFNTKPDDELKLKYLHTIMEQNWIIIRELDRIAKALEQK